MGRPHSDILIIEDDLELAALYRALLHQHGWDNETIHNGRAALERLQRPPHPAADPPRPPVTADRRPPPAPRDTPPDPHPQRHRRQRPGVRPTKKTPCAKAPKPTSPTPSTRNTCWSTSLRTSHRLLSALVLLLLSSLTQADSIDSATIRQAIDQGRWNTTETLVQR